MASVQDYLSRYDLRESDVYLLELIPLIEMIWADGRNQEAELKLLYRFTVEHLSRVSRHDSDVALLSEADINGFINRFTEQRPEAAMLAELREFCLDKMQSGSGASPRESRREILDYCLDIAAACVKAYPYKFNERIVQAEKDLLHSLFNALGRAAQVQVPCGRANR